MPRTPHPYDWDRHFGPRAHRRRGPLGLLSFTTVAGIMLAVLIVLGNVGVKAYTVQAGTRDRLTITPLWATAYARQTAAVRAKIVEAQPSPTSHVQLPVGHATTVGNLRSEPHIAPGNILGQLAPDDVAVVLEAQPSVNPQWYRVRITHTVGSLKAGSEGWVSATVLAVAVPQPASTTVAPSATP